MIILDSDQEDAIPDMNEIFKGTIFIHATEIHIKNILCGAIMKLNFSIKKYRDRYNHLLDIRSNSELEHYINELNSIDTKGVDQEIELEDTQLSYYFKTYLVFVKSVLDKTIPFINYRFNFSEKTFESRGNNLLRFIRNKYKEPNSAYLINLIETNKIDWLDNVLKLRDNFVHYSNLNGYKDFSILQDSNSKKVIKDLNDFEKPHIVIGDKNINALDFLNQTHEKLKLFVNGLLIGLGFDLYHKPEFITTCNKCGFQFADFKKIKFKTNFCCN